MFTYHFQLTVFTIRTLNLVKGVYIVDITMQYFVNLTFCLQYVPITYSYCLNCQNCNIVCLFLCRHRSNHRIYNYIQIQIAIGPTVCTFNYICQYPTSYQFRIFTDFKNVKFKTCIYYIFECIPYLFNLTIVNLRQFMK